VSSIKTAPFTRYDLLQRIREEQGNSEQTEILIDYIEELWETIDLLHKQFGKERTEEIINASSPFPYLLDDL
jgi:hypothetical protein